MSNLVWDLFVELRKELLESQKIRSQIIGFKISFVSAAIGLIATNIDLIAQSSLYNALFVMPALAAICFDLIINSYSFSIKRIGCYTQYHIEPKLKSQGDIPQDFMLWQDFLKDKRTQQNMSLLGNTGFNFLAVVLACISLYNPFQPVISNALLFTLLIFFVIDILAYLAPKKLDKQMSK